MVRVQPWIGEHARDGFARRKRVVGGERLDLEFSNGFEASDVWRGAHVVYGKVGTHEFEGPFGRDDSDHVGEEGGEMGKGTGFDEKGYFCWVVRGGWCWAGEFWAYLWFGRCGTC